MKEVYNWLAFLMSLPCKGELPNLDELDELAKSYTAPTELADNYKTIGIWEEHVLLVVEQVYRLDFAASFFLLRIKSLRIELYRIQIKKLPISFRCLRIKRVEAGGSLYLRYEKQLTQRIEEEIQSRPAPSLAKEEPNEQSSKLTGDLITIMASELSELGLATKSRWRRLP